MFDAYSASKIEPFPARLVPRAEHTRGSCMRSSPSSSSCQPHVTANQDLIMLPGSTMIAPTRPLWVRFSQARPAHRWLR
ncbi:unnamed protein product [Victoria cruziana]